MKAHVAARRIADALDTLVKLRTTARTNHEIDKIDSVFAVMYDVGNSFYPKILKEIREERKDLTS